MPFNVDIMPVWMIQAGLGTMCSGFLRDAGARRMTAWLGAAGHGPARSCSPMHDSAYG